MIIVLYVIYNVYNLKWSRCSELKSSFINVPINAGFVVEEKF